MKTFQGFDEFIPFNKPVVSIGTFDGVHIGHRIILDRLNEEANRAAGQSLLITLWPHPRMVIEPDDNQIRLLTTMEEKMELLQSAGLDNLLIIPFSADFARTGSEDFIRNYLVNKIHMHKIIIGYDHHFGRNREGSLRILQQFSKELHYEVEEIHAQQIDDINVSSTKIRNALLSGDVKMANEFLGYSYFISGQVVKGKQLGRQIGFPTANVRVNHAFKLIPANGVYAVEVALAQGIYKGMMNIGVRPTFENPEYTIEVHLFDFEGDIYRHDIKVYFKQRLRSELKFGATEQLLAQLKLDEQLARKILSEI